MKNLTISLERIYSCGMELSEETDTTVKDLTEKTNHHPAFVTTTLGIIAMAIVVGIIYYFISSRNTATTTLTITGIPTSSPTKTPTQTAQLYQNPFITEAIQYQNPFDTLTTYQNPFTTLK